jgi:hypothetical protein
MKMRLTFAMTAALLLASSACAEPASAERSFLPADGRVTFTIEPSGRDGMVQFQLSRREGNHHWMHGRTIEASALQGFGGADGPVRFRVARDAGTIDCDGVMRSGRAIGECSFTVDAAFSALLVERGMGAPSRDQAFSMAMSDIGRAYLDELARQRYDATTSAELARAGDHGVRLDYLVAMGGHGYRVGRLAALIRMRDHGVTPAYIADLARLGVRDVPADDIVRLRDHGVSAELVVALRGLRVAELDTDDIVRIRDHGVSTAYVSGLRDLGYAGISAEELVRLRSHGVSTDFIRRVNGDGARRSPDELVALRNGGFASN